MKALPCQVLPQQTFRQVQIKHQEQMESSEWQGQEERHRKGQWDSQATPLHAQLVVSLQTSCASAGGGQGWPQPFSHFLLFCLFFKVFTSCSHSVSVLFRAVPLCFFLLFYPVNFLFLPSSSLSAYFPLCYLLHFSHLKRPVCFHWWNTGPHFNSAFVFLKHMKVKTHSHWTKKSVSFRKCF